MSRGGVKQRQPNTRQYKVTTAILVDGTQLVNNQAGGDHDSPDLFWLVWDAHRGGLMAFTRDGSRFWPAAQVRETRYSHRGLAE